VGEHSDEFACEQCEEYPCDCLRCSYCGVTLGDIRDLRDGRCPACERKFVDINYESEFVEPVDDLIGLD
jgi:hypothetical protein